MTEVYNCMIDVFRVVVYVLAILALIKYLMEK